MPKTRSTIVAKATPILWVTLLLLGSPKVFARVDCSGQFQSALRAGRVEKATQLLNNKEVPALCSFFVAWALKDNPVKARPYMHRIRNILNPQEPFYYEALYLKLLLLDDLTDREISRALNRLSNGRPDLARELTAEKEEQFRAQYQQLLQNPFSATIVLDSPWISEDMPEKVNAQQILALRDKILARNRFSSKENAITVIRLLIKLKQMRVQIDENHNLWASHNAYIRYFDHLAIANNTRKPIIVRIENARQASDIQQQYGFSDNNAAATLLARLEMKRELIALEKALNKLYSQLNRRKPLSPPKLNLKQVRKYKTSQEILGKCCAIIKTHHRCGIKGKQSE